MSFLTPYQHYVLNVIKTGGKFDSYPAVHNITERKEFQEIVDNNTIAYSTSLNGYVINKGV